LAPFDCAFIDEVSTIPLAFMAIPAYYSRRWVILGDTRQLPPIVRASNKYVGAWSLMEVAVSAGGGKTYMLHVQRRGARAIFEVISKLFYQGMLKHHEDVAESRLVLDVDAREWLREVIDPEKPLVWVDIGGASWNGSPCGRGG
jgi:DNA replication ATP-dependent helicase Dna2